MADTVGELGLETDLTCRVQVHTGLALTVDLLLDLVLQGDDFLLLEPGKWKKMKWL